MGRCGGVVNDDCGLSGIVIEEMIGGDGGWGDVRALAWAYGHRCMMKNQKTNPPPLWRCVVCQSDK